VEGLITTAVSALFMPPGILLVLLSIALFLTWRRPRLARGLVFFSVLALYALYRERIAYFRNNPPPADWDGSWRLERK